MDQARREQIWRYMEEAADLLRPYVRATDTSAIFAHKHNGVEHYVGYSIDDDGASVTVVIGFDPGTRYHFPNQMQALYYFYTVSLGFLYGDYRSVGMLHTDPNARKEFLGTPGVGY